MLLNVYGSIVLLKAFNYRQLSNASARLVHALTLGLLLPFWLLVILLSLPPTISAVPASLIMAYAFAHAARKILKDEDDKGRVWLSAGWSYGLWCASTIPLVFLPVAPEVIVAGYVQIAAQLLAVIALLLLFIGNSMQSAQGNLQLATISGSLLSHDLRNYLNVAQGAIDLVNAKDDEAQNMIATATRALHSAIAFMHQTQGLWTELGTGPAYQTDIDLQSIVKDVVARANQEHTLRRGQISIEVSDCCYISASSLIGQVIWNIIDNSIEHATSEPKIRIRLLANSNIVLSIADWSGGISQEQKERIMSKKSNPTGLGIGLMLVREISHIYGIPIDVQDNMEDGSRVGTVFTMTFPYSGGVPSKKH